jgi:hypothetical protein
LSAHEDSGDLLAGVRERPFERSAITVAPDTWMRVHDTATELLIGACSLLSALVGASAVGVATLDDEMSTMTRLACVLFLMLGAVLLGSVALWRARAGLRISPRGVCLRGVVRTHRLSLDEVEEFVPASFSLLPLAPPETGVRIMRPRGGHLDVWATAGAARGGDVGPEALHPLCDELNRLLRSMRG